MPIPLKSLTKRFVGLLAKDDAQALIRAMPPGFDPMALHVQGDILPLRSAMFGSIECLLAMAKIRTAAAEDIFALADGNGERAIDWASAYASMEQTRQICALAPLASSLPSSQGHWPLARALDAGLWESAALWLASAPASAKLSTSFERSALHLCAEPGFGYLARAEASSWTPPSSELVACLLNSGANALLLNSKGYSPIDRASRNSNETLTRAILESASPEQAKGMLSRAGSLDSFSSKAFNPGHEAVRNGSLGLLRLFASHGLDLAEKTEGGFGLIHLAIRAGHIELADALFELGVPLEPAASTTSCPLSAMSSPAPLRWLQWLRERGADMEARDDHRAHWAEVAWEKLSHEDAEKLWDSLGASAPLKDWHSMLGALERAARSKIDPAKKIESLIHRGLLPAKINLPPSSLSLHERLDALPAKRISGLAFGTYRILELGAMWSTSPDTRLHESKPPANGDDFDDIFESAIAKKPAGPDSYRRPCLIAYCASRGYETALDHLMAWDALARHFAPEDYLCAWREGILSDSKKSILEKLGKKLDSIGLARWGSAETILAVLHLGPDKARRLDAPIPDASSSFAKLLGGKKIEAAFFLELFSFSCEPDSYENRVLAMLSQRGRSARMFQDANAALSSPWELAIKSPHAGSMKALLRHGGAFGAISALHCALACCQAKKPEFCEWIAKQLPVLAKDSPPGTPWAERPEMALTNWDEQIGCELARAGGSAENFPIGACSNILLSTMLLSGGALSAAKLLPLMRAPAQSSPIGAAIGKLAHDATAIGENCDALREIRLFCEAMLEIPAWAQTVNGWIGRPALARLPDPSLFESFYDKGALVGSGARNACSMLCLQFASRISPAFAQRLAEASRMADPANPLAVTCALASMRPRARPSQLALRASKACELRVARSTPNVDASAWEGAAAEKNCPVSCAFLAGNADLAIQLAACAPEEYRQKQGGSWMAMWIASRSSAASESMLKLTRPIFGDKSQEADKGRLALSSLKAEIEALGTLGTRFGQDAPAEALAAAKAVADSRRGPDLLTWLIEQGLDGSAQAPLSSMPYRVAYKIQALTESGDLAPLPELVPLACAAMDDSDVESLIILCETWSSLGFPMIVGEGATRVSITALMRREAASAYESRALEAMLDEPRPETPRSRRL